MTVSSPIVRIISFQASESFYAASGSKILLKTEGSDEFEVVFTHPEGRKWSSVAAVCEDETLLAICDCEKNLYLFEIPSPNTFKPVSVPMHLAKTATSVKFTDFPSEKTLLVSDKFGDVLRFQMGEEFDCWARESRKDSKSLSIHTKATGIKRSVEEVEAAEEEIDLQGKEESGSEAHHCTIIGHISMVTDLHVLPLESSSNFPGGLIVTCDRDEKVRLTLADQPERIHSFGMVHREFVGTLSVCPGSKRIYSAGGDSFVAEWQIEGENDSKLSLKSKIPIKIEGKDALTVQEIKVNAKGSILLVHVDNFGLLRFEKDSEADSEWKLKEIFELPGMTAFDFTKSDGIIWSLWSPETGVSFSDAKLSSASEHFDQITPEEGKGILELLSKSKLKKDVERIDWKQKKHANQKLAKPE